MTGGTPGTNRWCERLGLPAAPRVENFAGRRDLKLFHLMVITLLGSPARSR